MEFIDDPPRLNIEDVHPSYLGNNKKKPMKEFESMLEVSRLTSEIFDIKNPDLCKIFNIMDDYNLKPNEYDSGIESLNVEARNTLDINWDWKTLNWKCRNCNNELYSRNNPSYNCGEEGTWNWCHCDNCDTYFDKEGTIRGMKSRKEFGTDFLDRGVWN